MRAPHTGEASPEVSSSPCPPPSSAGQQSDRSDRSRDTDCSRPNALGCVENSSANGITRAGGSAGASNGGRSASNDVPDRITTVVLVVIQPPAPTHRAAPKWGPPPTAAPRVVV